MLLGIFIAIALTVASSPIRPQGPPPPPPTCDPIPGTLSYRGLISGCTEATQTPCIVGEQVQFDFKFTNPFPFQGFYNWLPEGGAIPIPTTNATYTHRYTSPGAFPATVVIFVCVPHPTFASRTVTVVNGAAVPISRTALGMLALSLVLLASLRIR
jgi:hypothetical protein